MPAALSVLTSRADLTPAMLSPFSPMERSVLVGNTAASSSTFNSDFALARYDPDGSLDGGFGAAGHVTSNFDIGRVRPGGDRAD